MIHRPKRISIFCGHYGSGKTNIAVNYALHLKNNCELQIANCELQIANCKLQIANCNSAVRYCSACAAAIISGMVTMEKALTRATVFEPTPTSL